MSTRIAAANAIVLALAGAPPATIAGKMGAARALAVHTVTLGMQPSASLGPLISTIGGFFRTAFLCAVAEPGIFQSASNADGLASRFGRLVDLKIQRTFKCPFKFQ